MGLIAVLPGLPGIAAGLLLAGLFQSGVMIARSLGLRERLPEHAHAGAYSVMYAAGGIGYGLTAALSAVVLSAASPAVAVVGGAAVALVTTAVCALAERGRDPGRGQEREQERETDRCAEARAGKPSPKCAE
ncbi:MFS transporter [Streptomyces sp. NPDC051684]|uniref:MFS transporter n=1 Tax=Streptomyces sp. NPDC051684 TaxID=3365670 RepID=UPI00379E02AE